MPTYLHPGVYIEEIPSGARPIEAVSTSTPIFVGAADAGPVNRAEFILKWDDYKELYGGVLSESDAMGLAVSSFYSNGGGAVYVARLAFGAAASSLAATAAGPLKPKSNVAANPLRNSNVLSVTAKEVGTGGDAIKVTVAGATDEAFTLTVTDGTIVETYEAVSMNERSAGFVVSRVNETSQLVELGYLPTFDDLLPADQAKVFPNGSIESSAAVVFTANTELNEGGVLNINVDGDGVVAVQIVEQYNGRRRDWAWEIARSFARATHVLTEHLDAFANEGFLGTATQWEYLRRLVAMIDYRPAPPASASTTLALIAKENGKGLVQKGFQVKHTPQNGDPPVVFETLEDVEIDPALNGLRLRGWNDNPERFDPFASLADDALDTRSASNL